MLIKGGMLLAIDYDNDRFTTDVDFSTEEQHQSFDREAFLDELKVNLADAVAALDQNLDCRVQSHTMKPARADAIFPTLSIKIAHAYFGTPEHERLTKGNCPTVLAIDYSLNELQLFEPAEINLGDGMSVQAYSLPDLIGEKYRAMLQQVPRNRSRGRDVYDIHRLLNSESLSIESDDGLRRKVHVSLVEKSATRRIEADELSMRADALVERLRQSYYVDLQKTVEALPPFDEAHDRVARYYESLPWNSGKN